jgi:hypothetical protein
MTGDTWLAIAIAPCLIAALGSLYAAIRSTSAAPPVPDAPPEPAVYPKLSMIVPACNEADTLEDAMRAKLSSDYPDLEIVLVEDRSTDDTPRIADAIAASDPRVRVVHIEALPEGWLGKVHALDVGVRASTGEWFILSDADVHLSPTILKRTIAQAIALEHDYVPLVPRFTSSGPVVDLVLTYFMRLLVTVGRVWDVNDPKSKTSAGGGAFMAARRAAYDQSPGFSWLKLEVGDDVVFGQMMKDAGARTAVYACGDDVAVRFYPSIGAMMRGLEKNAFTISGRYSLPRHIVFQAIVVWLEVGAWVGIAVGGPIARILGLTVACVVVAANLVVARWSRRPSWTAFVPCLAALVFAFMISRGVALAIARGGVSWRGTFYRLEDLRRETRIVLPY